LFLELGFFFFFIIIFLWCVGLGAMGWGDSPIMIYVCIFCF
jgi:hypothetical protein